MSYPNPPGYPPAPGYGPPPQPTHLRGRTPRRLGWIFLIVAVVLFVIGGVVVGTKSLGKVGDFQRIDFSSGTGTVDIDETGKWVIYYEASDVSDDIDSIPRMVVAVATPSDTSVDLRTYGNRSDGKIKKFTYDYEGHKGAAAFEFTAREKGTYTVRLRAVDSVPRNANLAFGRDIVGGAIAGGLLIVGGVLFIVAAIVLLIVGFVKRSRHKKELAAAGSYGAPPPPGYGGQPGSGFGGAPPPAYGEQPDFGMPPPPGYGTPPAEGDRER